jgi:hypothetical protein
MDFIVDPKGERPPESGPAACVRFAKTFFRLQAFFAKSPCHTECGVGTLPEDGAQKSRCIFFHDD